jgi:hypothetical protein
MAKEARSEVFPMKSSNGDAFVLFVLGETAATENTRQSYHSIGRSPPRRAPRKRPDLLADIAARKSYETGTRDRARLSTGSSWLR